MSTKLALELVEQKIISRDQLEEISQEVSTDNELIQLILKREFCSEATLLKTLAAQLKIPYQAKLKDAEVSEEFIRQIPLDFARRYKLIALRKQNNSLEVVTANPFDFHPLDELSLLLGLHVTPVISSSTEIENLINRAYQQGLNNVDSMLTELDGDNLINGVVRELESGVEDLMDVANKAPIIKLVSMVLSESLQKRASDVHFHPYEDKLKIRARVDGLLHDLMDCPKQIHDAVISRIKVLGKMDIAERRAPQDGRASIKFAGREVDVRISVIPSSHGERAVLRLLDKSTQLFDIEKLGLASENQAQLRRVIRFAHGMILVTGPTGSGKTTSLYTCLSQLNSDEKNIITIEDPIEYQLAGITQMQINPKKDLTFANSLRSIVRHDPDILMVGEIRDYETAGIAIQSALTGHLIFSTLHTNDSASAITRLLDLGVEPYLVSSSVMAVLAQRLIRKICPHCREEYASSMELLNEIGLSPSELKSGKLFRGRKCEKCFQTGYYGRTGIFELLTANDQLRQQVIDKVPASSIKQSAVKRGLQTLRMDGAQKVLAGITTIEEVLRVTQMDIS